MYGATLWQISMDKIAHEYSGCPGHFPIQIGYHFIGMEGVTGIADDMVIAGRNEEKHNRNFLASSSKGQGNNEIFPWDDELSQQVQCNMCTPQCTPQLTHTPGQGL